MTDSAGGPRARTPGWDAGASATGRGLRRRRRRRWVRFGGLAVAVGAVAAVGTGWALYAKLDGNITRDEAAATELRRYEKERPTSLVKDAQNILLIGSDTRSGDGNDDYGRDSGTERSDTTILLHLAANRHAATAISLPRDLMVDIPACLQADGTRSEPMFAMFNHAFEAGGSACTIRTVEKLTDIRVDHHIVIDFHGFKEMVDAVDGVQVCLRKPIDDEAAKLKLPAGRVTLDGEQALGYVRARKTLGDGSDTDRMDRQQRFLGALVHKVQSNDVLLNPVKLYPVLDAATSSLTTDPELAGLRGLYQLVRGLRDIPTERVQFLTVPRESYVYNANRDQLVEPEAQKLFARLRRDEPLTVAQEVPRDSATKSGNSASRSGENSYGDEVGDSQEDLFDYAEYGSGDGKSAGKRPDGPANSPSPAPTFRGSTAAEDTCE